MLNESVGYFYFAWQVSSSVSSHQVFNCLQVQNTYTSVEARYAIPGEPDVNSVWLHIKNEMPYIWTGKVATSALTVKF